MPDLGFSLRWVVKAGLRGINLEIPVRQKRVFDAGESVIEIDGGCPLIES